MGNGLVVFSVIKNGIINGYPFVESYSSWFDFCDEVFVLDGYSTDGTTAVLEQLSRINKKFRFEQAEWPTTSKGGSSIAEFTNECLRRVRSRGAWLCYMQADEFMPSYLRRKVADYRASAVEFLWYSLFWNTWNKVVVFEKEAGPRTCFTKYCSIKLFPSHADISSCGDGLSFDLRGGVELRQWEDKILHYGWNFPVNILQKHVSHANLYPENVRYFKRGLLCKRMLRTGRYDIDKLDALDPIYFDKVRPFVGIHPECVQHLLNQPFYDPYVGLSLLSRGVRW